MPGTTLLPSAVFENSTIKLGEGADDFTTTGEAKNSTVYGGLGNDTYTFTAAIATGDVVLSDTQGTTVAAFTNAGTDIEVTVGSGADKITVGTAELSLSSFTGGAGNDTFAIDDEDFAGTTILAGEGNDSITLADGVEAGAKGQRSVIYLGAGNDTLTMGTVADTVAGLDVTSSNGDNYIVLGDASGSATDVNVTVGDGSDTISMSAGSTSLIKLAGGNDDFGIQDNSDSGYTLYGGEGTDTLTFEEDEDAADAAFDKVFLSRLPMRQLQTPKLLLLVPKLRLPESNQGRFRFCGRYHRCCLHHCHHTDCW